ncbi:MAG: DUF896 domain-containing protein [Oscillospiraceae bacterium]
MTDERITKINELAVKSRTVQGLTTEEKLLQKKLREEYIAAFRGSLKGQLDNITIVDEKGNKTKLEPKNK